MKSEYVVVFHIKTIDLDRNIHTRRGQSHHNNNEFVGRRGANHFERRGVFSFRQAMGHGIVDHFLSGGQGAGISRVSANPHRTGGRYGHLNVGMTIGRRSGGSEAFCIGNGVGSDRYVGWRHSEVKGDVFSKCINSSDQYNKNTGFMERASTTQSTRSRLTRGRKKGKLECVDKKAMTTSQIMSHPTKKDIESKMTYDDVMSHEQPQPPIQGHLEVFVVDSYRCKQKYRCTRSYNILEREKGQKWTALGVM